MKKITLIDYDMGNIFNVIRAFESLGCKVELTKDPEKIVKAERLVLPGVGAFEDGISNLKKLKLDKAITEFIKTTRPILGICIGMQLMMTKSEENGLHEGLNLIKRHTRPNPQKNIKGGIVEREALLHMSNVQLVCPECSTTTRIGHQILDDGRKVRFCRKCDGVVDK